VQGFLDVFASTLRHSLFKTDNFLKVGIVVSHHKINCCPH
jgi:hypothetical protein